MEKISFQEFATVVILGTKSSTSSGIFNKVIYAHFFEEEKKTMFCFGRSHYCEIATEHKFSLFPQHQPATLWIDTIVEAYNDRFDDEIVLALMEHHQWLKDNFGYEMRRLHDDFAERNICAWR